MARILILTPQLPYPPQSLTGFSQGTTIRNFNLLAGLARRHTVDLLTFLTPEERRGKEAGEQGQHFWPRTVGMSSPNRFRYAR